MAYKFDEPTSMAGMDRRVTDVGPSTIQSGPVGDLHPQPPQVAKSHEQRYSVGNAMSANDRQVGGDHYKGGIEHWDYVLANEIPYLEAQVIKYVSRWRKKNGFQDLEKARHFLDKLIEYEQAKAKQRVSPAPFDSGRAQSYGQFIPPADPNFR